MKKIGYRLRSCARLTFSISDAYGFETVKLTENGIAVIRDLSYYVQDWILKEIGYCQKRDLPGRWVEFIVTDDRCEFLKFELEHADHEYRVTLAEYEFRDIRTYDEEEDSGEG
jgi:hypothetical protein